MISWFWQIRLSKKWIDILKIFRYFINLIYFSSNDEVDELEDVNEGSDNYDSEECDDVGSLNMIDTKSHFTDYSMSSSIIRRNENLKLLDNQFEKVFIFYLFKINGFNIL